MLINGLVQIEDLQTCKSSFSRFVLCNFHLGVTRSHNSMFKLGSKEPRLVLVTCNKTIKYKVLGNIKAIKMRELRKGKISFILNEPNHCIMMSCEDDVKKFREFVQLLSKLSDEKKFGKLVHAPVIPSELKYVPIDSKKDEKLVVMKLISTMGVFKSTWVLSSVSKDLQSLSLADCSVKHIPREFGNLSWKDINLENTGIRDCHLQWLDEHPVRKSLKKLNLSKNQISTFPSALVDFQALQMLNLCDNTIEHIPGTIGSLRCLRYFNLSQNRLRYLPLGIETLSLFDLNLAMNDLNTITKYESVKELNKTGVPRLQDLAAVYVDPVIRGRLTAADCPPVLLEKLRRLSKCICHKRSIPCTSTRYFVKQTRISWSASYCINPQRHSSVGPEFPIFLEYHLHANVNTRIGKSYVFPCLCLKSQSKYYRLKQDFQT